MTISNIRYSCRCITESVYLFSSMVIHKGYSATMSRHVSTAKPPAPGSQGPKATTKTAHFDQILTSTQINYAMLCILAAYAE